MIMENIDVDNALKLQQPMPDYCQCCGELIADESGGVPINTNYCYRCGQKLWWNKK